MNYLEILDQVKTHVENRFQTSTNDTLVYHNLYHTEAVARNAVEISNFYKLSDKDFFIVLVSAWFHDVGYLENWEQHEQKGAAAAALFLEGLAVDPEIIQSVRACILSTKMPQSPQNLLEQILCDADLYHFGGPDFKERNKLMRKETEKLLGKEIDKDIWGLGTIKLMESHQFHTSYCINKLADKKRKNLEDLKRKMQNDLSELNIQKAANVPKAAEVQNTEKKNKRPERGIETMFRITSGNHQRLSDMADNKAHIMISTNSIILSVILSILLRRLEDNPQLIIPTMILLLVCVITMVFSILATRPSVPSGKFTLEDIENKSTNLLFFGNFYRMGLTEYNAGIQKMMEDRDYLYGSLIKDIYAQGVVLGRKYRLLRIAYNVFMFGIVAAVVAFVIAIGLTL